MGVVHGHLPQQHLAWEFRLEGYHLGLQDRRAHVCLRELDSRPFGGEKRSSGLCAEANVDSKLPVRMRTKLKRCFLLRYKVSRNIGFDPYLYGYCLSGLKQPGDPLLLVVYALSSV